MTTLTSSAQCKPARRSDLRLRIASCQFPVSDSARENAGHIKTFMYEAAAAGAHLLHTSEACLSGYAGTDLTSFESYDWQQLRQETAGLRQLCQELSLWLALGSAHFLDAETKPTNCLYLIDPDGEIADRYDKSFLASVSADTGDRAHYTAGNRLVTRDIHGVRVGLAICYDICWPQLYIGYRERGVTVMLHSFHNARMPGKNCLETLVVRQAPTRCADNRLWAVCNNSSQPESEWGSFVARPDATIAKQLPINQPGMLIHEFPDGLSEGGWFHNYRPMQKREDEIMTWEWRPGIRDSSIRTPSLEVRPAMKNYMLILLMVVSIFTALDRVALGLVLEDIKASLDLTDTQLGVLTGIAFAVFYSLMGIPLARWADRGNRVTIISLTAGLWSIAVALSAAAGNFVQLLLVRVSVAVGETGCAPATHSLIAEYFTRTERARAVSLYMLGTPLALSIGYLASGWLNEAFGWRMMFVILGLPGLALALLARLTLVEPRVAAAKSALDSASPESVPAPPPEPSLKEVCTVLWASAAFRHLLICYSVWTFFGWGILQWQPAFFIRSHGIQTGELGTWFAGIYGIAGGIGVYLGGAWASRYAARNERLQLQVCAAAFVVFAVLTAASFLAANRYWALGLVALAALGGNVAQGPILGTIQTLVAPRMRAMSIALMYFFANLIGTGLGPLAVGAMSDALRPWVGEESLRWSLVFLCPGYFWAAWHLWRASRTVLRELRGVQTAGGEDDVPVAARVRLAGTE